jgi:biotin transport system substrate-specific component
MAISNTLESYDGFLNSYHSWRKQASLVQKLILTLGMAALTGLAAQIQLPSGTPVPITGQTFAVLLAGVFLGRTWGGVSQALYVGLGFLGLPWFAGMSGGSAVTFGATGGYLLGFVLAAFFLGAMMESRANSKNYFSLIGLMWFASFVLIQVPGLSVLALWYQATTGEVPSLQEILNLGLLPFVPGDVIKILLAASVAKMVLPKNSYAPQS